MQVLRIETFDNDWFVVHTDYIEKFIEVYNKSNDIVKIGKSYIKKSNIKLMEETNANSFDLLFLASDDTRAMKRAYQKELSKGLDSHESIVRYLCSNFGKIPDDAKCIDFISDVVSNKYNKKAVF